ncbi:hypothetical protein ACFO3J_07795 [Streptomyces polygonati]|uniref:Uncharacterized protein n=1 Tax=Streptomyces polygonati TaxID=1617087 RepID=A0ABV8HK39_9ACTN
MSDSGGTPQLVWDACVEHSELVFRVHDQVSWQRDRRLESGARGLTIPLADGLTRTLLALSLYARSNDVAAATGRHLTGDELAGLPLLPLVAEQRRHYELFTGLETVTLDPVRSHLVGILKLLTYEQPGHGALMLARLGADVHIVVVRLTDRYRNAGLAVGDLRAVADGATGDAPAVEQPRREARGPRVRGGRWRPGVDRRGRGS